LSIAPDGFSAHQRFQVTHPFHPLFGREFEAVTVRHNWGENRVYYHDEHGRLALIPTSWTSLGPSDPFIVAAHGRACFRVADLLRLAGMIQKGREEEPL
jgi:hypothetical protein